MDLSGPMSTFYDSALQICTADNPGCPECSIQDVADAFRIGQTESLPFQLWA